jgi:hypothetical protein
LIVAGLGSDNEDGLDHRGLQTGRNGASFQGDATRIGPACVPQTVAIVGWSGSINLVSNLALS